LKTQRGQHLRVEWRAGLGSERELKLHPYELVYALGAIGPAWRFSQNTECVLPLYAQRYWSALGERVADWLRFGARVSTRLGAKSRLSAEPSLNRVIAHQSYLPLAVAGGRPAGTSAEWRLDGSLDLSRIVVGRASYRGRSQSESLALHRLDLIVEASF
jgi:hypothetical protein